MRLITIPVLALVCLAIGCGEKNPRSMTYSDMKALSDSGRTEVMKKLTKEETEAIAATGMKYAMGPDSVKFQKMTIQEMIDEGHKIQKGDTAH